LGFGAFAGVLCQTLTVSGATNPAFRSTSDTARPRRWLAELVVVFVAYYLAGKLGQAASEIRSSNLGPVWPAYGIALAAVILFGFRIWPALIASAFLVAFQSPVPHLAAAGQAVAATLAALGGGAMLRQAAFDRGMTRLRDALNLIALGAAASAMISATLGVAVLYAAGVHLYSGIGSAWLIYWLGDATGVLLVAPLVLTAADLAKYRAPARIGEAVALFAVLIVVCMLVFGDMALFAVRLHVLALAVLPVILWAAVRFGTIGVSLSTLPVAAIATVATALGLGPFAQDTAFINAVLLDAFFAIVSLTGLMLAAVVAERAYAQAQHERLVADQAGLESRLRLAAIVESSEDAIVGLNLDGSIADWNAGAAVLYGYDAAAAIGRDFLKLVQPDSAGLAADQPDVITRRDAVHRRKDGARVAVALTYSPIHDAKGALAGESVIARDVTERLRANALRDELAHLGRVSMLSVLTGALAHEINQPLTAIGINTDTAEQFLSAASPPLDELRQVVKDINADNQRAAEVIQRIRSLLRNDAVAFESVEVNATVADVVKLVKGSALRRGIRIDLSFAAETRPVRGDRVQVQQVILNLLMNACDAVTENAPQFRRVSLRTLATQNGVAVLVKDSGAGLSDEELARIFEPFYTTKSDGMGLGLSICRAIVAAHNGTLEASRNSDQGMTFTVTFPRWQ
jgi:two-component system sensor kinase FixL